MRSLAERLKEIAGSTPQKVVVAKSGLGSDQVSKIWSGETRDPRWSTMVQLLRDGLGVSLDDFAGGGPAVSKLSAYDADDRYAELVAKLHALSKRDREKAIDLISWVLESRQRQEPEVRTRRKDEPAERESKTDAPQTLRSRVAQVTAEPQSDTRRLIEAVKSLDEPGKRRFFEQLANERDAFDTLRLRQSERGKR